MKLTTYLDLEKSCYHICLNGELDACSCLLLDEAMDKAIRQKPRQIQIDCQALQYISSAGLGVFVTYMGSLSSKNISLVLHHLNSSVKNTFDVTRLPGFIPVPSQNKFDLVLDRYSISDC
jgi:anti-sigma B factor antagonist